MEIASYIDHTALTTSVRKEDVRRMCDEAFEHGFASVCIPPYFVKNAMKHLEGRRLKVSTVIGFPFGFAATFAKVDEIKKVVDDGASEVDAVINLSALAENDFIYLRNEIDSMTQITHLHGKQIKIILETALLQGDQLEKLCALCTQTGVDFVKTSTGHAGGATPEVVRAMRKLLPPEIKIKASGGIKTRQQALSLIEAGADRIGTSSAFAILEL